MGSVRPLRIDAELIGEELDRGTHPEGLMRSNRIVHRLPVAPCVLHAREIGLAQGNRILSGDHLEEIALIPVGLQSLVLDPDLRRLLLLQQIHRDVPQDRADTLRQVSALTD